MENSNLFFGSPGSGMTYSGIVADALLCANSDNAIIVDPKQEDLPHIENDMEEKE